MPLRSFRRRSRAGEILPPLPALRLPPHPWATAFALLVAVIVVTPLASLILIAAGGDNEIWSHIVAYVLPASLSDTLGLLAGVAAITVVVGVGTAWIVTAFEFPGRNVFTWLLPLPLAFPTYIVAYVYVDICDQFGPLQTALLFLFGGARSDYLLPNIRSLGGAIFVMGIVLYPYVYLAARAMFQTQSTPLIEMARVLGASRWNLTRHITVPLARPAIAAGLSLALLETLNDIGASEYLGVRTLTLSIFTTWLNRGSLPGAAQIACSMLIVIAGLIALERYGRRGQQFLGADRSPRAAERIPLMGGEKWIMFSACLIPVALGFLLPAVYLVHATVVRSLILDFDPSLIRHTLATLSFAAIATAIALFIGFGGAIAVRLIRRPFAAICLSISGLGYALPGTVLALGLLSPLVAMDEGVNWVTRALGLGSIGLVLAGSGAAVIIAYVIRFLAVAIGFGQAGLARISTELDDAARTLGTRPVGVVRLVHIPLGRPALWGASLLIFVDCLKELPATLLLRPLNVETLSTYIYQFATRGSFEEGALASLLIVAVGILPVIHMVRFADDAAKLTAAAEWSDKEPLPQKS